MTDAHKTVWALTIVLSVISVFVVVTGVDPGDYVTRFVDVGEEAAAWIAATTVVVVTYAMVRIARLFRA